MRVSIGMGDQSNGCDTLGFKNVTTAQFRAPVFVAGRQPIFVKKQHYADIVWRASWIR